jgi:hypothetical protein
MDRLLRNFFIGAALEALAFLEDEGGLYLELAAVLGFLSACEWHACEGCS